jgi:hypothetical protein
VYAGRLTVWTSIFHITLHSYEMHTGRVCLIHWNLVIVIKRLLAHVHIVAPSAYRTISQRNDHNRSEPGPCI